MKRLFLLIWGLAAAAGLLAFLAWVLRPKTGVTAPTGSAPQPSRDNLLLASALASSASLASAYAAPAAAVASPITKVSVNVNLQANIENTVAFAWNARKLSSYIFVDDAGTELPELELTKTADGFTVVTNEAFVGKVYLFLFSL